MIHSYNRSTLILVVLVLVLMPVALSSFTFGQNVSPVRCAPGVPVGVTKEVSASGTYFVWKDCPFDWIEIEGTGTNLNFSNSSVSADIMPAGFVFPFYTSNVAGIDVCSNGFINFNIAKDATDSSGNVSVPSAFNVGGDPLLMPAFVNLRSQSGTFSNVFYQSTGSAPNRVFVIQWSRVAVNFDGGLAYFQVQLSETTGDIKFLYRVMSHRGQEIGSDGMDLTIGIQKDGTEGIDLGSGFKVLDDEFAILLTPHDMDLDGLPNAYETEYGYDPEVWEDHGNIDTDNDGLDNLTESQDGTDPTNADTDNDGLSDGDEDNEGTHPRCTDSDVDGLLDGYEVNVSMTDPLNPDSDFDLLADGIEVQNSLNPLVADGEASWDGLFTTPAGTTLVNFDFYVDSNNGSDFNDGLTPATAFASIGVCLGGMGFGDSVYIAPGIYTEQVTPTFDELVFFGAGQYMVILDATGETYGFYIDGYEDLQLSNMTIRMPDYCIDAEYAYGLRVDNMRFFGSNSSADFEDGDDSVNSSEGMFMDENTDGSKPVITTNCCFEDLQYGFDVEDGTYNVTGCVFRSVYGYPVYLYDIEEDGDNINIVDCDFRACGGSDGVIYGDCNDDSGVYNIRIEDCRIMYCSGYGIYQDNYNWHWRVENNLIYGCTEGGIYSEEDNNCDDYDMFYVNNTIVLNAGEGIYMYDLDCDDVHVMTNNNITHNSGYGIDSDDYDVFADFNNYFANGAGDTTGSFTTGSDDNSTAVDPMYTDLYGADLRVMAGSPLNPLIGADESIFEPMKISVDATTLTEGDTGTTTITVTVSLSRQYPLNVTVDVFASGGSATSGTDYATAGLFNRVTIPAGQTEASFTVNVNGDVTDEGDETIIFQLGKLSCNLFIDQATDTATITNDDFATISVDDIPINESDSGDFTVSLATDSAFTITVDYTTTDNTASSATDYTTTASTLTFTPGQTSKTVTVNTSDDTLDELNETFFVDLTNPTMTTIADNQGLGTITDDDTASITIDDVAATEGTDLTFTVTLSTTSDRNVSVNYASADNSATVANNDYEFEADTLTINAGSTSQQVTVTVNSDTVDEVDETFFINLSSAVNSSIGDSQGIGTILDDDTASVTIDDVNITEGDSGSASATFTVTLSTTSDRNVSVNYASADNTATLANNDYESSSNTLTVLAGSLSGQILVTVNGDTVDELDETFFVNLSTPVNTTIVDAQGVGTIQDNDTATISIDDVNENEGDSGNTSLATFTVSLSTSSDRLITVEYDSSDISAVDSNDYDAVTGMLSFAAGTTGVAVDVTINGDDVDENNETFQITLSNAQQASISDPAGVGTINDDDTAGVTLTETSGSTEVFEGGRTDDYSLVLDSQPSSNVLVTVTSDMELQTNPPTVLFTTSNWNTPQWITVTAVDDMVVEGPHMSTLTHSAASNDDFYDGINIANINVDVDIVDNDALFADAGADQENNPGVHFLAGNTITGAMVTWTQTLGTAVTLDDDNSLTPQFTALAAGQYRFNLETMANTFTENDTVDIVVTDVAPVAVTSDDFSIDAGTGDALSGTGSFDSNGTAISAYEWALYGVNNPVGAIGDVLDNAFSSTPTFLANNAGVYMLSLTVTSAAQDSTPTVLEIMVTDFAGNVVPPAAHAGVDQNVSSLSVVTLNGHDSIDPDTGDRDGDLTFVWRVISQPAGANATLSDNSAVLPTFIPGTAGMYVFGLVVTDDGDDNLMSLEDTTVVFAFNAVQNTPPTAVAELDSFEDDNSDNRINTGETFTLTGVNSIDPDNDFLTYAWQQLSGPAFNSILTNTAGDEMMYTALAVGTYVFELVANDGDVDSEPVELVVQVLSNSASAPVAVARSNGSNPSTVEVPQPVAVPLDGSQSSGTGLSYHWVQILGPTVLISSPDSSSASFTPERSQTYVFELTVTSQDGNTDTDILYVAVSTHDAVLNPGGNGVPVPVIVNITNSEVDTMVTLDASGSTDNLNDPDGVVDYLGLIFYWTQTGGPLVQLDLTDPARPTFTPTVLGEYTFEVRVDDGDDISPPVSLAFDVIEQAAAGANPVFGGGGGGGGSMDTFLLLLIGLMSMIVIRRKLRI